MGEIWNEYRKFSNKCTSPKKVTLGFLGDLERKKITFFVIFQPKIVRFSFCKKPPEAENLLSLGKLILRPAYLIFPRTKFAVIITITQSLEKETDNPFRRKTP